MSVSAVNNVISTTSTASAGFSKLDSDAFLKLLCTQLQHQDPLNPIESTEYMTQLAQLTSVQELQNISSSIDTLLAATKNNNGVQWFSTIGKKMNVESSYITKGDQVVVTPKGDYDTVKLTLTSIKDGSTKEVTISNGESLTYTYDGSDPVAVSAIATKDKEIVPCTTSHYRVIEGVKIENGTTYLVSSGGEDYPTEKVMQIK